MRKLYLMIGLVSQISCSFAQTNIFPSSGNAGIGTLSPAAPLQVSTNNSVFGNIMASVTPGTYSNGNSTGHGFGLISNTSFNNNGAMSQIGLIQTTSNVNDMAAGVYLKIGGWYQNSGTSLPIALGGGFLSISPSIYIAPGSGIGMGNVGIGTTNASQLLTLNNNGAFLMSGPWGTGNAYDEFIINNSEQVEKNPTGIRYTLLGRNVANSLNANGYPVIRTSIPTSAYNQAWAVTMGSGNSYNNFTIWGGNSSVSGTALSPLFNISNSGNVGIGTTNPDRPLVLEVPPIAVNTTNSILNFSDGRSADFQIDLSVGSNTGVAYGLTTLKTTSYNLAFAVNNGASYVERMRITSSGNVGIGTTNPQSALAVNGTITGKQVTVTQTGWPDFVFDPAYRLPTLSATATYIKTENHLPGIPSGKEIEKEGLNLGEMQQKQMQKIEELTLYLIKQNKDIEGLKRDNAALKKEIEQLKNKKE